MADDDFAVVLLDVMSGDPKLYGDASLNSFLKPHGDRLTFVGQDSDAASGDLLGELTLTIGGSEDTSGDPGNRSIAA